MGLFDKLIGLNCKIVWNDKTESGENKAIFGMVRLYENNFIEIDTPTGTVFINCNYILNINSINRDKLKIINLLKFNC